MYLSIRKQLIVKVEINKMRMVLPFCFCSLMDGLQDIVVKRR